MGGGGATLAQAAGFAGANVHALPDRPEALERLLGRRDAEDGLVPVDPVLIRSAVEVARAEVRRVTVLLERAAADPTGPDRRQVAAMTAALVYLGGVIEGLERALGGLQRLS